MIEKALFSLWTKPFLGKTQGLVHRENTSAGWLKEKYHWFSWILSVNLARQHFKSVELVGDKRAIEILVDWLELPFTSVKEFPAAINDLNPNLWSMGKIFAIQMQDQPFVHQDADVYLWKGLPMGLQTAPAIGQDIEWVTEEGRADNHPWYIPKSLESVLRWLPPSWIWARDEFKKHGRKIPAVCCGIMGGTDLEFTNAFATQVITLLEQNKDILDTLKYEGAFLPGNVCVSLEQLIYGMTAMHQCINVSTVFKLKEDGYIDKHTIEAQYTHMLSQAKNMEKWCKKVEHRIQKDYMHAWIRVMEKEKELRYQTINVPITLDRDSISVVVPTTNPPNLKYILYALQHQTRPPDEIIISCSADNIMDQVVQITNDYKDMPISIVEATKKYNRSAARNMGIRSATGNIILFFDQDSLFNRNFLALFVLHHHQHFDRKFIAGGRCTFGRFDCDTEFSKELTDGTFKMDTFEKFYTDEESFFNKYNAHEEIGHNDNSWLNYTSFCFAIRKRDLIDGNLFFDENFNGWGEEDPEFFYRLHLNDFTFRNITGICWHVQHPYSPRKTEEYTQNIKYFIRKHPEIIRIRSYPQPMRELTGLDLMTYP